VAVSERGNGQRPAVFLDKDGTLIENVPYNVDPARMQFAPGVPEGLRILQDAGFGMIVVTNQSGVARGYFDEEALQTVEQRLRQMVHRAAEVDLLGFYYCPHHREGIVPPYDTACDCRKPEPGMLLQAAEELKVDCDRSWMVGDILNDVEAGHRSGCRSVLVDRGSETEWELGPDRVPDYVVADFVGAARVIATADRWRW
jgi:D,D-heptose 1,7-bisphosphate phosphatase